VTGDRYNITAFRRERDETDGAEHDHMTGSGSVDTGPTVEADGRRWTESDTLARESLGVFDLVEDPEAFEAVVAEGTSPLAVVGGPFSGRTVSGRHRFPSGQGTASRTYGTRSTTDRSSSGGVTTSSPGVSAGSSRSSGFSRRSRGPTPRS
jgi:hypothetical protein